MDAMSDAIDNAEVMLYAVSELYKESGNCRLEANYAHQQDLDMIPCLVQEGYQAKGWLALLLGTRLCYPFYDCEDDDEAAFEARVDPVAHEIGGRGATKEARLHNLIRSLAGSVDRRAAAYTELTALTLKGAPDDIGVAAACVGPLIETVLCKDVSEVDAEEYQRAATVLGSLCWMDRQVRPKLACISL